MMFKAAVISKTLPRYTGQKTSLLLVVAIIFGLAIAVLLVAPSGKVSADAGSGGTGGGCVATDWCTSFGWGWAKYGINSGGPTYDPFRDGTTTWNSVKNRCDEDGANVVYVFVILNGYGTGRGYNYETKYDDNSNHITSGGIDAGRATAVTTAAAKTAYDNPLVTGKGSLTWGSNVAWFCGEFDVWDLNPTTTISKNHAYPGTNVEWHHKVTVVKGTPADFTWTIQQETNNNNTWYVPTTTNTNNTNSVTNIPKWDYRPLDGNGRKDMTVSNVANGTVYCQRIHTNNPLGRGTTPGEYSAKKCVEVVRPTGTCSIDGVRGYGPGNIIIGGGRITGTFSTTNTTPSNLGLGDLPNSVPLEVTGTSSAGDTFPVTFSRTPGGSMGPTGFTINGNGYNSPTNGSLTITVRYNGVTIVSCTTSFSVYVPYTLTPNASTTGSLDQETADPIPFNTSVTNSIGSEVRATVTSRAYKQGPGRNQTPPAPALPDDPQVPPDTSLRLETDVQDWSSPNPESAMSFPYGNPGSPAGRYCAYVHINQASGYRGPGGATDLRFNALPIATNNGQPASRNSCMWIHNSPYFHVVNSDVMAGGRFTNGACTFRAGGIQTYTRNSNTPLPAGSGSQYAAISNGDIVGFNSAILGTTAPNPLAPIGLNFTNTGTGVPTGIGSVTPLLGRNMNNTWCVKDYFGEHPPAAGDSNTSSLTSLDNRGLKYYTPGGGTMTIGSAGAPGATMTINPPTAAGNNPAIYVDGNVYIKDNIVYGGAWTINSIPSLTIIARGNIYIDPAVERLSGIFIAQNGNSGTGSIYTCHNNTNLYNVEPPNWLASCNRQLVVHGSFTAEHVYLWRTLGSLKWSTGGEKYSPSAALKGCGEGGQGRGDCAAEVFIFSPEMYLADPSTTPVTGPTTPIVDHMTSLSPVL